MEEVKALGDAAFRARDFAKAERHYTSALQRAADCAPPPPTTLLASLHSNRAGTLAQLLRHEEALDDARAAVRLRPSWARAHSRVGAALLSLRRWDEARAAYDAGLQVDPGSDELRRGHAEAMRAIGTSRAARRRRRRQRREATTPSALPTLPARCSCTVTR